ncbi:hypothetical protein BH11BAC5_BH11BAC5_39160 [soil metagenome]
MKKYNDLNETEKAQLLKFPAYMSLLTSTAEEGIDKEEKNTAVKITHVKTFSSDPILVDFYKEAEIVFEKAITELDTNLPHNREDRKLAIHTELDKLETLLNKLDPGFVAAFRRSMRSYGYYISKAHQNVLEYFIFPMPIQGISD